MCLMGILDPFLMPKRRKQYKVLVVDDSTYNLFVMQELLQHITPIQTIITALNGQEALSIIDQHRERMFDVIFMDIHMPVLDGPSAVAKIRQR